jgi:endonuclease-3
MADFAEVVLRRLSRRYGKELRTQLRHRNMTHLFVAVLLSPQCTDEQVNKATEKLFLNFRNFNDYANADLGILRKYLKGINYYKTKAKHLKAASRQIIEDFGGRIPRTIPELMELQGVGRKVANVILNEGYGINEGIAVDTHAAVTARRLGFARSRDPYKIEQNLMRRFPPEDWGRVSNLLVELGRDTCKARSKECYRCTLRNICPSSDAKKRTVD